MTTETKAQTEHIPGPWTITPSESGGAYIEAPSDRWGQSSRIALIGRLAKHRPGSADRVPPDEIQAAHARLIAAAPDLLAACEELIALADDGAFLDLSDIEATAVSRKIRAALANATGE